MQNVRKVKKAYTSPTVKRWGTIADLTRTGLTNKGSDGKVGSVLHSNGQ